MCTHGTEVPYSDEHSSLELGLVVESEDHLLSSLHKVEELEATQRLNLQGNTSTFHIPFSQYCSLVTSVLLN